MGRTCSFSSGIIGMDGILHYWEFIYALTADSDSSIHRRRDCCHGLQLLELDIIPGIIFVQGTEN